MLRHFSHARVTRFVSLLTFKLRCISVLSAFFPLKPPISQADDNTLVVTCRSTTTQEYSQTCLPTITPLHSSPTRTQPLAQFSLASHQSQEALAIKPMPTRARPRLMLSMICRTRQQRQAHSRSAPRAHQPRTMPIDRKVNGTRPWAQPRRHWEASWEARA